jgi:hypothetical protein
MNQSIEQYTPNTPAVQSHVDPAAVAAAESVKARIQAQYLVALSHPRSYDQSRFRIMEACRRPSFADKVEYKKPVGKTTITGPSIRFAELALREWGNIDYSNTVVYDDEMNRRISVVITDLETNTTFSSSIQITKTVERKDNKGRDVISERINSYGEKIYIVKATEDEVLTKQAAMISKALRNEGLRLIPQEIIEEAVNIARLTQQKDASSNMDEARKKISDAFGGLGIQPKHLEEYLGHPMSMCVPAEITDLRAIYNAIKNGEAKWNDFVSEDEDVRGGALQSAKANLDALKNKLASAGPAVQPAHEPEAVAETPTAPAAGPKEAEAIKDLRRILADTLGELGLGLSQKEAEARIKKQYKKGIKELSALELQDAITVANTELKKRDK